MSRKHSDKEWEIIVNEYYNTYHTLNIPVSTSYKGYNIGRWVCTQKEAYKEERLNPMKKEWLDSMGVIWDNRLELKNEDSWNMHYKLLLDYYNIFHNVNVPLRYEKDGVKLGRWLQKQRERLSKGKLDKQKENKLLELGINSNKQNSLCSMCTSFPEQALLFYVQKMFPRALGRYKGFGFELDVYVRKYRLGFEYDGFHFHENKKKEDENKNKNCLDNHIELYRIREVGCPKLKNCKCYTYNPKTTNSYDSLTKCLKRMFKDISIKYNKNMIDIDVCRDMHLIMKGISSNISKEWLYMYQLYKECVDKLGTPDIPAKYVYKGHKLGSWCSMQRQIYLGKKVGFLSNEQKELLESIGFCWNINSKKWDEQYLRVKEFIEENNCFPSGKCRTYNYEKSLYYWIRWQRKRLLGVKRHPMTTREYELLEQLGIFQEQLLNIA